MRCLSPAEKPNAPEALKNRFSSAGKTGREQATAPWMGGGGGSRSPRRHVRYFNVQNFCKVKGYFQKGKLLDAEM